VFEVSTYCLLLLLCIIASVILPCCYVNHCSAESLRKPVLCSVLDVVKTYKSIVNHWPVFEDPEKARNHAFFLTPKPNFKNHVVWYKDVPVGRNTLAKVVQKLAEDMPSLDGKRITNKTGRNTGISRLEEARVPLDRAIQLTGHRDIKSYKKYSKQRYENASACAM
jgi:hypothetical protein